MERKKDQEKIVLNDRFHNMLQFLTKYKHDYQNEKEHSMNMRNKNIKLETELKEVRELEKSHRYHLLSSREMIANLQETVSCLLYLKRDVKRLKDEMTGKGSTIVLLEREKEDILQKHNEAVEELRMTHKQEIVEMSTINEKKAQQIQYECDTQIAQFTCVIEELRNNIKEMEAEYTEKMNVLVLDYEEKIQRSAAQVAQLQDQLTRQTAHTDANVDVYRRKLEELEEKLKQYKFKEYLAHNNYSSDIENRVERPYSVEEVNAGPGYSPLNHSQNVPSPRAGVKYKKPVVNTLKVVYQEPSVKNGTQPKANDKKGQFNITKKRKLYNEKDFLNM